MTRRLLAAALLAASLSLPAAPAPAQDRTTVFQMDALDARAFAMGGTLVTLPRDETALRWNPSLLVFMEAPGVTAGYSTPASGFGASHTAVAGALLIGRELPHLSPGVHVRRSAAGAFLMGGGFDLSEGARWSETQVGAGYAYAIAPYISVGGTLRLLGNSTAAAGASVSGYAVDAGVAVRLTRTLDLGLGARNLMSTVKWKDLGVSEALANVFAVGLGLNLGGLRCETGMEASSSHAAVLWTGAEADFLDHQLKARGGMRMHLGSEPRAVPTLGAGFARGRLRVDVAGAFDATEALGVTRAFSLGYRFK
ncbi:MAG: hypothetical protein HZB25_04450 [Candidatus Eisenbacteria bacterium]|nr:hypothetical protein [Candidatus Eisenbacteria bacterium]